MEKIRYYNEESSYLVGRLRCSSGEAVTIVGSFPPLQEGESLLVTGKWQLHHRYGRQVAVERWERLLPATEVGLKRYLSSGLIKGIGPVTADAIVKAFGMKALEIMEKEPERLQEIPGIGPKRAALILESFSEYREMQDVLVFLQGYGIGVGQALRLYRHYGPRAVDRVKENPYSLAEEVLGIGFKTADRIARRMGLSAGDPARVRAALLFALSDAAEKGHVYLPRELIAEQAGQLLAIPGEEMPEISMEEHLEQLARERKIHREDTEAGEIIYAAPYFYAERDVARQLIRLAAAPRQWGSRRKEEAMAAAAGKESGLTAEQRLVLEQALSCGVLVVTGGPGTGKTTTIRALLSLFHLLRQKVLLAAPTGRAAKRVSEATGEEAFTIHRLLEYSYIEGEGFRFLRHAERPLEADVLIIDESSMVDLMLMYHLVRAIPEGCRLILVGDADQLPAVGAGNVLKDILASEVVPAVRLNYIFRQARESLITLNAHRVNRGEMPHLNVRHKDFFFIEEAVPDMVASKVVQLCCERIPNYGPFDPVADVQVITPMRRTSAGVERLNKLLQNALNPYDRRKSEITAHGTTFRVGDKVMQIRNNYQKEVYNGDIGLISSIDLEEGQLTVTFRDAAVSRPVAYDFSELDELTLSYAISVHKSQGSEYPVIVMPVITQHYLLLQRNLLYTGITRARKLVVLVGTRKALAIAVRNNRAEERYTYLNSRLRREGENIAGRNGKSE
ncbi:MAG: ATP-dependent RecD-like DNA helicase [Dethiobacteria bacterium]|nr:ATP-dependent RecD-like DNA helicase [Bacillota bacterium]HOJ84578.1 ATP-dependent RecD-like DNA helicase [Bacillota bacterium]